MSVNTARFQANALNGTAAVDEQGNFSVQAKAAFTALAKQLDDLAALIAGLTSGGWKVLTIAANSVTPDLADARNFKLTINQATRVTIQNPVFTGGSIVAGDAIRIFVFTDTTANRPTPAWGAAFGTDVTEVILDHTNAAIRFSVYNLIYQDDNKWHRTTDVPTGMPL